MSDGTIPDVDVSACLANLVSYEEIAAMFNVQKATVWRWKSLGLLPEPAGEISGQWLWTREEIFRWAAATNRTIIC